MREEKWKGMNEIIFMNILFQKEVNINVNLCRLIVNSYFNNYNSIARIPKFV